LKRGLEARADWEDFGRAVTYLSTSRILQFIYEQVDSIVADPQCKRVLDFVLATFDRTSYALKYDGRCRLVQLRLQSAEAARAVPGNAEGGGRVGGLLITSGPLGADQGTIADYLDQPRGDVFDAGVVEFGAWRDEQRAVRGEEWEIRWFERYNTDAKRKGIKRDAAVVLNRPLTMGCACEVGKPTVITYTGHKVGSAYGLSDARYHLH
jgi:hypothetical protein